MLRTSRLAWAAVVLALTSCAPTSSTTWHKANATRADFDRDTNGCFAQASERFPQLRQAPPPQVNVQVGQPRGIQFSDGSNLPGPDLNAGGRQAAYRACMMDRGWVAVATR